MSEITICRRFKIDAAHWLPNHEGACANLHGHRWFIDIEITGPVQTSGPEAGMVIDFKRLNAIVQEILDDYDHHCLNDIIENPTAENICHNLAIWLKLRLSEKSNLDISLKSIKVWETEDSWAQWS